MLAFPGGHDAFERIEFLLLDAQERLEEILAEQRARRRAGRKPFERLYHRPRQGALRQVGIAEGFRRPFQTLLDAEIA